MFSETSPIEKMTGTGILQMPQEVLIEIMKPLSSYELMVVIKAIPELRSRIQSFLIDLDFSGHAFGLHEMKDVMRILDFNTRSLTLEGFGFMTPPLYTANK